MTTTLQLDARQRAMLEEMGIKVWAPLPEAEGAGPAEAQAPARARAPEFVTEAPSRHAPAESAPAAPRAAPAVAAAPPRSAPPVAPVATPPTAAPVQPQAAPLFITAPERLYATEAQSATGGWLVVVEMPPNADGRHDALLDGEAGRLLDQMLRALRLHAGTVPVHALRLWRASPGQPSPEAALDFDAVFDLAVAPLAPQLVLALGPLVAPRLLGQSAPLGRLRGSVHRAPLAGANGGDCAVVASYHPAYLLRNGADKGRAWADLCLAAAHVAGTAAPEAA